MKVAFVTGGRKLQPTPEQARQFHALMKRHEIDCIVHGDCPTGADRWAKAYAAHHGVWHVGIPALWDKYGRAAGEVAL